MQLVLQVRGPLLPIEDLVEAIPIVLDRLRAVPFDSDGTAVLEGTRADRLQLIDGRAGRLGAAYLIRDAAAVGPHNEQMANLAVVLAADDRERTAVEAHATGDGAPVAVSLELTNPRHPARIHAVASMQLVELPKILGPRFEMTADLDLVEVHANPEPQLHFTVDSRWFGGRGTVHVRPLPDPGYEVTIDVRPRGLARLMGPFWPLIRQRMVDTAEQSYGEFLSESAEELRDCTGPYEIADHVWDGIVRDLTTDG